MSRLLTPSLMFLRREDGPTAAEYALVLALIVVVCIVAISALGTGVTKPFKKYSKSAALKPYWPAQGMVVHGCSRGSKSGTSA